MGRVFCPDGALLATLCGDLRRQNSAVQFWDPRTGKELRKIEGQRWFAELMFSPDGKTLAVASYQQVQLLEMPSGKELRRLECDGSFAFFPDGERLAVGGAGSLVRLCNASTGSELYSLGLPNELVRPFAISPDGRTLVRCARGGQVRLWEVATGKERRRLEGHDSAVTSAAFAQDGRTLLTGSEKGSVLVWDVARWGMSRSGELSSKDVQPLWQDLAGDDAVRAGRAIGALAATPGQTLPLLRRHVQPVAAADPRRLNQLVAQLDSERFPVRDSAGRQLEELGELAGPILSETLARQSSLELRQRVEGLLRKLDGPMLASDRLRDLRAVETLERIGTAEARQVLERIAKGTPEARVTREAKASVERLVKRPAAWP